MTIYIPFICLAIGAIINWNGLPKTAIKIFDGLTNAALILLMLVIGLNIGTSQTVMDNIASIGFNCIIISLMSIIFSVLFVYIAEQTIMPLEKIRLQLVAENEHMQDTSCDTKFSPLTIIMPACIIIGILTGQFLFNNIQHNVLDIVLNISLIFLYTGVGVSLGNNKEVFQYIKKLGFRVLFMPLSIFAGCVISGFISSLLLNLPSDYVTLSASGMGYYSLTGAFLTEEYGIEAGTYGFIVNVSRDFFTVLLIPLLLKISKGSPIASGASGCMDTMLVPVTKAVGAELGMVALISGTILTIVVPIWLAVGRIIL